MTIKDAIAIAVEGKNLTKAQAYDAMKEIMSGQATSSQIAGFVVALRAKGETADEIAGCALAMRDAATPLTFKGKDVVDTCGTGGDGRHSMNVSTAAAFVVAGAGLSVAKHGNRAISSRCGSADVLEALGVKIDTPVAVAEMALDQVGLAFLFAPNFHPAMKFAMPTRRELGMRTIFNLLGPLTNPARASVQLIGVYDPKLGPVLAQVMAKMGHRAGLVVHSHGWDEITLDGPTHVSEMVKGRVRRYNWTHKDFGLPKVSTTHLAGGDAATNARIIQNLLQGDRSPVRHVVVANAAAVLWISARARGEKRNLKESVQEAEAALDNGAAWKKCQELARVSHSLE